MGVSQPLKGWASQSAVPGAHVVGTQVFTSRHSEPLPQGGSQSGGDTGWTGKTSASLVTAPPVVNPPVASTLPACMPVRVCPARAWPSGGITAGLLLQVFVD